MKRPKSSFDPFVAKSLEFEAVSPRAVKEVTQTYSSFR